MGSSRNKLGSKTTFDIDTSSYNTNYMKDKSVIFIFCSLSPSSRHALLINPTIFGYINISNSAYITSIHYKYMFITRFGGYTTTALRINVLMYQNGLNGLKLMFIPWCKGELKMALVYRLASDIAVYISINSTNNLHFSQSTNIFRGTFYIAKYWSV